MDKTSKNPIGSPVDLTKLDEFTAQFNTFYTNFNYVLTQVESNRQTRNMLVDVDTLQAQGKLRSNQTYIAQRVVDTNISRDLPPYVAYLTQSKRLALFQPNNPQIPADISRLETEFVRVMTYPDWILDYIRLVDSAKLNGYAFVDVSFDPAQIGAVSVEFVANGELFFDIRVKDIQQSFLVARMYEITLVDLYEFDKDFGFISSVVAELQEKLASNNAQSDTFTEANKIFRFFFKREGKVWAGWYSKDLMKFLREPELFYNGIDEEYEESLPFDPVNPTIEVQTVTKWRPVAETEYPFYVFCNRTTENARVVDTMGRADMDFYVQEAACALWSAFVNGCTQASNVMWSPSSPNPEVGVAPKQLSMIIDDGKIWNSPMQAFTAPYPDAMLPKSLEMLKTQNSEDTNQISFATNNRRDTRKTATELEMAAQQDQIMSSVNVTLYAAALRKIFTAAWRIIQSQALQGAVVFCAEPDGGNNMQLIAGSYNVIPAGSVDYVERMERIASMQTDVPMFSATAAGPAFLEEYIKAKYPQIADKLLEPLRAQQVQDAQKVQALTAMLQAAVTNPDGSLETEWQAHSQELQSLGIKASAPVPSEQNATSEIPAETSVPKAQPIPEV